MEIDNESSFVSEFEDSKYSLGQSMTLINETVNDTFKGIFYKI
jgi:hypothetical protein